MPPWGTLLLRSMGNVVKAWLRPVKRLIFVVANSESQVAIAQT